MSEPLGEWVSKNGRRDFFVVSGDDAFGTESAAAFIAGLAKNGGTASGRMTVPAKSGADWAKVIAAIKSQPAKNVFAAFVTDDAEALAAGWKLGRKRAARLQLGRTRPPNEPPGPSA